MPHASRLLSCISSCVLAFAVTGCASQQASSRPEESAQQATDANSHLMVAEIALQRGEYNAAAKEYVAAAKLASDPTLAQRATAVAFENGQLSVAMEGGRRWLELEPQSVDAHRYLAVAALRLHQPDESASHFEPVLTAAYATPAAGFMDLSSILTDEDNVYGVLRVTQDLARGHQKLPEAQYAIGVAALRGYHYQLAVDSCRKALELDPDFADAEELLARALVVNGQNDEGLALARKRVETVNDTDSRLELALLLSAANEEDAARKELTALLDIPEARPEALRTLAGLDLAAGKLDDATARFNELVSAGRYVSLSFYSLGLISERRRDPTRAVGYYTRVSSGPYANDAQLRAARLLASSGAREHAIRLLESYTAEHPESAVEIAVGRAQLLAEEGDAENALSILDEMAARYPDNVQLQYARSVTLDRLDQVDGSIATLRALLAKRPKDPVVMNALGYTLADHNRELREAHSLVRDALEMSPDSAAVQDSMGWTLHRMGEQHDALKWLTKAYATEKDAEIAAHLGETLWDLGQRTQARAIWDEALARDPDHRYLLDTLRRYPE